MVEAMGRLKSPLLLGFDAGACAVDEPPRLASPGMSCALSGAGGGMSAIRESEEWGDSSLESSQPLQGPLLGLVKAKARPKELASPILASPADICISAASSIHMTVVPGPGPECSTAGAEGAGGDGVGHLALPPKFPAGDAKGPAQLGASIASIHDAVRSFQASIAVGSVQASPPPQGNINFIAQSKEWCGLDTSRVSCDSEPAQAVDRRQRYAKMAAPLSPDIGHPSRTVRKGIDPNSLRCWSWCFFFVEMWLSLACITLFLHRKHWVAATCLAPPHLLFMCLEVHLMRHDRTFLQWCHGVLGNCLLEALLVAVFGCLNCFPLVRARRCWRQRGMQPSLVDEIEAQCIRSGGGARVDGARFDSHLLFITGVPRMVVLTNILTGKDTYSFAEIAVICLLAALSLISVVQAVMNFDYYASRWIRKQYDMELSYGFHAVHYAYRLFEVTGRILVLVVVTKAFWFSIPSVSAVLVADYFLGIVALLWVTGFKPGSPQMILVLSVSIYVVDVCRYIDEHGITRQAKKVSKFFYWVRNLQLLAVLLFCWEIRSQHHYGGPLRHRGAGELLPVLAIGACSTCLALRKLTRMGHIGVDLFVASKYGHADLLEDIISSGCDVNMVQMDNTRETPLHAAAWRGQAPCVCLLLKRGADPNITDAHGENPLHRACRRGDADVIQMLVSPPQGAPCTLRGDYKQSLTQENNSGQTPLQVLRNGSPVVLAQMLLEAQQDAAASGVTTPVDGPSVPRSTSTSFQALAERVFGQVVRTSRARFFGEACEGERQPGLASFLFSTGIGEQLAEYLDSDKGQGQKVQLSSLRTQGVLGTGAFGRVFRVLDGETGEIYALKLQRRERTTKFAVREAQALHQSSHAYIVRLVQIFQTQNFYGLLMELCDKSLNACILETLSPSGRAEGLPEAKAARYSACITLALEYLHGLEIVFRDLKPDNVLMTLKERGDVAKLTDFGLARSVKRPQFDSPTAATALGPPGNARARSPHTEAGRTLSIEEEEAASEPSPMYASAVCGTPRFMAPEVYDQSVPEDENPVQRLRRLTSRDWYALGCCLQLMMLGEDGGVRVSINGRDVVLPPVPSENPAVLRRQAKAARLDSEAFQLIASLTAPVAERADAEYVRASPFMREAVAEMEAEARRYEGP